MKALYSDHHVYALRNYGTIAALRNEVKKARLFYENIGYKVSILWVGQRQEFIVMWRAIKVNQ